MLRVLAGLLLCAAAQAATTSATLAITATEGESGSNFTLTGTATLTGGIAGSGTFSATIPTASIGSGATASVVRQKFDDAGFGLAPLSCPRRFPRRKSLAGGGSG